MEKSEIKVSCNDQVLKITESPVVAAGGVNEVRVVFNFCEKWVGFVKTAIFYRDEEEVYYAVLDENDTCIVPWEVCDDEGTFYFSVFGEKDGTRRTASVVRFKVKSGAISSDMRPSEPTPDVYSQFLEEVAKAREENRAFVADVEAVLEESKAEIVSPIVDVSETDGGHILSVTDKAGVKTFFVMNGQNGKDGADGEKGDDGAPGADGKDGEDGYSPVRGKDYFTEEDKAEMVAEVLESDEITQMRQDLEEILADLNYKEITITEFSVPGAGTYEIGTAVPAPTVTWKLNKSPASQTLNGEALGVEVRSKVYTGTVTSSKTYTLVATGQKGEKATQSKSINILRGVYYGVLEDGVTINSAAILGLTRELRGDRKKTFTANAGATQRLAYALPSSGYGTPIFYVGGFEGGFYKAATVSFTNSSGHTENYDVWLSDELGNGETTVTVS